MKRLIIILVLVFMPGICWAKYVLRLNDGATLTWQEYSIEGNQYCTYKAFGKFCIQKSDVVALKEINQAAGNDRDKNQTGVSAQSKLETSKNGNRKPAAGEKQHTEKTSGEHKTDFIVHVVSAVPGAIYFDGYYTGKSVPADITLARPGSHRVGLGGLNNRYQEIHIDAKTRKTDVYFKDSGWLPPRIWKIMLLSVRNMYLENNRPAHLTDKDIAGAYASVLRTAREWIKTYTYGLAEWHVDKMTVENVYGHLQFDSHSGKVGDQIDDGRLITDAKLMRLLDNYDAVLVFWPSVPDGSLQDPRGGCRGLCCFRGTSLVVPNACGRDGKWTERAGNTQIWIHEWLHTVEGHYGARGFSIGKGGVHGAEEHGYSYDEQHGWLSWYKDLMRGQVREGGKFVGIPPAAWLSSTRTKTFAP